MKMYWLVKGIHPGLQANLIENYNPGGKLVLQKTSKTKQQRNTLSIFSNVGTSG